MSLNAYIYTLPLYDLIWNLKLLPSLGIQAEAYQEQVDDLEKI